MLRTNGLKSKSASALKPDSGDTNFRSRIAVFFLACCFTASELAGAQVGLSPGDLVALNEDTNLDPLELTKINPDTGEHQPLCDVPLEYFYDYRDLVVSRNGLLYYTVEYDSSFVSRAFIEEVNPDTCASTTVFLRRNEPPILAMAIEDDGRLLVARTSDILRVEPQRVVYEQSEEFEVLIESGQLEGSIIDIDLDSKGDAYVLTSGADAPTLLRVDATTGALTLVSQSILDNLDNMQSPKKIAIGPNDRVFVYDVRDPGVPDDWEIRIFEIDIASGEQVLRNSEGRGPNNRNSAESPGTPASLRGAPSPGLAISNDGRYVYFNDGQVVEGGPPGVSFLDLQDPPDVLDMLPRHRLSSWRDRLNPYVNSIGVAPEILGSRFTDVPSGHWAYSYIETIAESGISRGCRNDRFCPDEPVSRAQMAVFLERGMRGGDFRAPKATGNVFNDVPADHWAADFIELLSSDGITSGCGDNSYCPDVEVSRAQMAVFLLRAKYGSGHQAPPAVGIFDDVPLSYWVVHWIEQLAAEGITSGCEQRNFCPEDPVTRAQMAVFLVRTFGL